MAVAAAAVNQFKTITHIVGLTTVGIYTAPVGYTGVVLLSQVTNMNVSTQTISFSYSRNGTDTEIVKDLAVPPNDTANLLPGKLVIETGDSLTIVGSTATGLKYLSSILETSNL
jgi:hypothetical protein|tara:strand:- start:30 stop:371 length:342 start_codon:yes stop_codon:yes gene_type:complete